jgi:hypothetical protein
MKKAAIDSQNAVITHHQAPEKSQPRVGALDFPAPFVAPQLASVRIRLLLSVLPIRGNQLHAPSFQSAPQRIAVISRVGYDALRTLPRPAARARDLDLGKRGFCQRDFVRGCRRQENSQRNTLAINQNHPLRTLAPLGFSHGQAPFFAEAKLPSKKVSSQRSRPRRSSCDNKVRQISSSAPCISHSCKRRQQVDPLGYCGGKSRHRAPLRNTHKTPSKQARLSAQGRPRPSRRRLSFGKSGANFFHCWSVIMSNSRNHNPLPS